MTQIKIEVPANDHIALSAMAEALQRIAAERAPSVTVGDTQPSITDSCDKPFGVPTSEDVKRTMVKLANNETFGAHTDPYANVELNALTDQVNQLHEQVDASGDVEVPQNIMEEELKHVDDTTKQYEEREQLDDTLDADGLPWDKRIHSRGKTRLSDNTWRLARKPNDKTDEEWSSYVESVKAELKAVQDIPTLDEQCDDVGIVRQEAVTPTLDEQAVADLTPPVTLTDEQVREEVKEKLESGEVTVEAPLTPPVAPVAPVTPPTSLTPPVVESTVEPTVEAPSDQPSVTTFQELMLYITGNAKKRGADNDMIKAILAEVDPALTAIPLIATRADLIPKFVTALEAKLS